MKDMFINFLWSHREYFAGLATAYAFSHLNLAVDFVFNQAMKISWLHSLVLSNPDKIKAAVDSVRDEIDKDIDAEAKKTN